MRMRSTGLGKTELLGTIADITRADDYLVLQVSTIEPVKWKVRVALDIKDILTMLGIMLKKPSRLVFVLTHLFKGAPSGPPPEF
jgi:hypothetical protein